MPKDTAADRRKKREAARKRTRKLLGSGQAGRAADKVLTRKQRIDKAIRDAGG